MTFSQEKAWRHVGAYGPALCGLAETNQRRKKKGPPNETGLSQKQERKFYRPGVMPLLALPLGVVGLVAGSGP